MYLRNFQLRNVKCFRDIEVSLSDEQGEVRRWTALLGENGLGKSTLLQAMAVPLAGPGAIRELLPVAEGWVREGADYGEISAEILWHDGDAQIPKWPKKTPYTVKYIVSGSDPERLPKITEERPTVPSIIPWAGIESGKKREKIAKELSRLKQTAYAEGKQGWLACGYGPFRRLTGGSQDADRILYSGRRAARFVTLFREDAALTSATDWLVGLHNLSREGDAAAERSLDAVRGAFASSFFLEPAELALSAREAKLILGTRDAVPFRSLSDGYRSMLALGIDLLRWIVEAFPETSDPLNARGVVLIDELDAHLHPIWQRRIGDWLLDKFPHIQFIVATHSPFLAQVSPPGGNIVLSNDKVRGVVASGRLPAVTDWRAEQILTELFGLHSTRSPLSDRALRRLLELQEKIKKNEAIKTDEKREYEQLRLRFPSSGGGDDPAKRVLRALDRALKLDHKLLERKLK